MALKEHDFVKINYTAKLKDGSIFDTTIESVAKENHLSEGSFGPQVTSFFADQTKHRHCLKFSSR